MTIAFIRHGEPRRSESDPGLTSAGRRMAMEAGQWLASQGLTPTSIQCTPTQRTRDTAEELSLVLAARGARRGNELRSVGLAALWRPSGAPRASTSWSGTTPRWRCCSAPSARPTSPSPYTTRRSPAAAAAEEPAWRIHAAWPGRAAL